MEGGEVIFSPFFGFGFESDNFDIHYRRGFSAFRRKHRCFQSVFQFAVSAARGDRDEL